MQDALVSAGKVTGRSTCGDSQVADRDVSGGLRGPATGTADPTTKGFSLRLTVGANE